MKDEARKFLEKAARTLRAAESLLRERDYESAAGRCYYAMLHAAQALLRERDLRYRKHASVHAAYGEAFAKTGLLDPKYHRWLLDAFADRLRGDYDVDVSFDKESVTKRIDQAREFLDAAQRFFDVGAS
ncbi:MAG: HEPN domain-containing protein [Nitrospirota bacterium]